VGVKGNESHSRGTRQLRAIVQVLISKTILHLAIQHLASYKPFISLQAWLCLRAKITSSKLQQQNIAKAKKILCFRLQFDF